ncbi:hypothetical protein JCM33374_g125 [Metschnikowia sp. JCM 33374]|nr:hypothetical protein JCM33374_g125 [Metschnikowia sp. JCM 33374]
MYGSLNPPWMPHVCKASKIISKKFKESTYLLVKMLKIYSPFTRRVGSSRDFHFSASRLLFKSSAASPSPAPLSKPVQGNTPPTGDKYKYDKHPILKRIPRFIRPYTTQFITAPVSHVSAFVILHEITAIVPLIGIWYVLHQYHDTLMVSALDLPSWALEKGTKTIDKVMQDYDFGNYSISEKIQFIKEGAYAYVIVKSLFPFRLAVSILGMPWFAKWFVLPFTKFFSRKKHMPASSVDAVGESESAVKQHQKPKIEKPRL